MNAVKRIILGFILLVNGVNHLAADFFAFRKLTHPDGNKAVYLLYDINASIRAENAPKIKSPHEEINEYTESRNLFNKPIDAEILSFIDKEIKQYTQTLLQNLTKQHDDLKHIFKNNNASLIAEDNFQPLDTQTTLDNFGFIEPEILDSYIKQFIANTSSGEFRGTNFTIYNIIWPITKIGFELTGNNSREAFNKIQENYFYNPLRGIIDAENPVNQTTIKSTIDAVNKLFNIYNQSSIIIAENFFNIVYIAEELKKMGYTEGPLIISESFEEIKKTNQKINSFFEHLEKNQPKAIAEDSIDRTLKYALISKPLDLQVIFAQELTHQPAYVSPQKVSPDLQNLFNQFTQQTTNLYIQTMLIQ